ncbi:hypothetical protein P8452_56661 [Trifolium repens]|nr:hypothetical protein P8452_56661 [Trifolium repens]
MDSFCIPWPCVDPSPKQPEPEKTTPNPPKSFAKAVTNVCEISLTQLPQACVKGDRLAIAIPEMEYNAGLDACKHNLHGRIFWPKGLTPLTVSDLKSKLSVLWKDLSKRGVSSLGRGYYEFVFTTLEDFRRVRSIASWNLNPGFFKLFAWSRDFNPRVQQNSSAQVWVRFYGLSQEYWRPNIIFAIASSIGTPICIDSISAKPMLERTFGQFVRVLVDMDLSQTLRDKVLIERVGFAFFVDIDYENLPPFCTNFMETHINVINVESDKVETEKHPNVEKSPIGNSNHIDTVILEASVGKSKATNTAPTNPLPHQNRFSLLSDNPEGGSISSKQPSIQNSNEPHATQRKSNEKRKEAFSEVDLAAVFKEQDKSREVELSENSLKSIETNDNVNIDDDVSSHGSYIDATQDLQDKSSNEGELKDQGNSSMTPPNVKKDMAFLNESWANMVENEDQEARLQQFLEQDPPQAVQNFQVVLSKSQKKAQKKQNISSKDSYATRSKVNLKPFK